MLGRYLDRHDYNPYKDYEYHYKQKLLKTYKYQHLLASQVIDQSTYDQALKPKDYLATEKDSEGFDVAHDVMDKYSTLSYEEEKQMIALKAKNIEFLRNANDSYVYCRTRCKILDQRLKTIAFYPAEYQKCFGDCLNVRTELFSERKPGNELENKKQFVWIA